MADADRALFVAGIEAAVVDAYRGALEQQSVPPELVDTVLVLAQHHDEHCTAMAAIARTPRSAVARNERLHGELAGASMDAASLARVEDALAATHLASLALLADPIAASSVASILPVEAVHAVVLDPTALPVVQTTDAAYDQDDYA